MAVQTVIEPDVIELICRERETIAEIAARYGASNVRIFGSVARGTATPDSDVDMLVDFEKPADAAHIFTLQAALEALLDRKVDLAEPQWLHWYIRDQVLHEAVPLTHLDKFTPTGETFMRDEKLFLHDILERIQKIEGYVAGLSEPEFYKAELIQDGVIRSFEIIGEAVKKLSPTSIAAYPEVNWSDFAGFHDVLAHQYFRIDLALVWAKVQNLPALKRAVELLLQTKTPSE